MSRLPDISRRSFLKGTVLAGTAAATGAGPRLLFGDLETVIAANPALAVTPLVEDFVPTTCWIGKQDCGIIARRINGRVISLEGQPEHPLNVGALCPKGPAQITALYDPNRVKTPLIRTNAKGQSGTWRRGSWKEALALVAARINETRQKDPKLVLWQKGRSKAKSFYDDAFVKSLGSTKLGHGAYCSDAGYRALEYTIGLHGVLHPDFRETRYLLSWGWNITSGGGNKYCWIVWPRQMLEARERGMKIIQIDPRLRGAGPFADRWLPIRPGTDLALALAFSNVLVAEGYVDGEYLARYTNAATLVKSDGTFVRVDGVPQVWDAARDAPAPLEMASQPAHEGEYTVDAALEGEYTVDGMPVRPAFELYREQIVSYTPEWAANVCGLGADEIRRIAIEFGQNAKIGSTTVVDGVEVPYRPVGIAAYHMSQQELGFQAVRAMLMMTMLVGAPGAVGGQMADKSWKVHKNYTALDEVEVKAPPYEYTLKASRYFPINSGLPGMLAKVMLDPERYGVEELPEVLITHMVNPLVSFPSRRELIESYAKFKFVADISPWLSETADYFADVVLPAATLEKYEGPHSANDQYTDAVALRVPAMAPLFESRGEIDIYLDLTEAVGVLYGEGGYLDELNKSLKLEPPHALPLDKKPKPREIFDHWALAQGIEEGVVHFETKGVYVKGPMKPTKRYGYVTDPPFGGALHRFYGESLLRYRTEMEAKGAEEVYWRDYTPFPTWRSPTLDASPADYDLYLISYKLIEYKQNRAGFMPLLAELAPRQRLDVNPRTARGRGIADGDEVWVESHNAVTGETRRLKTWASYTEAIRPDTVGMPNHFGLWADPRAAGRGPSPNEIYYVGEGYMTNTNDQSFLVKVRVSKA
ncbi:MAG: molybdopterin-dependent oxidoreductase [Chloroflexota bacterium]